jgi:hypothetical protein
MSFLLRLFFGKEVFCMAVVYATLIIKGKKTIGDVPARIREQVKQILIDLDCAELIED